MYFLQLFTYSLESSLFLLIFLLLVLSGAESSVQTSDREFHITFLHLTLNLHFTVEFPLLDTFIFKIVTSPS